MFGEEGAVAVRNHFHSSRLGSKASVPSRLNIAGGAALTRDRNSFLRSPNFVILLERRIFASTLALSS